MRVIMFQPRFEKLIVAGRKTGTVRKNARCKHGEELSLRVWSGLPYRSKQRELARTTCDLICDIRIYKDRLSLAGCIVSGAEAERFAKRDGFTSFAELTRWFESVHGLPFSGQLIGWTYCAPPRR